MNYFLYLSLKIVKIFYTTIITCNDNMAESERFELSNGFKTVTPLAGERLRPLGQLSIFFYYYIVEY